MRRSIAWLRRDLRLTDNRVLAAATEASERVWPVFVFDPQILEIHSAAAGRVAWFAANVRGPDGELWEHGAGPTVLSGPPERELPRFAREIGVEAIFAAADEDPEAIARDVRLAAETDLQLVDDTRLLPPSAVRTTGGEAYSVFSPFRRALEAHLAHAGGAITVRANTRVSRLAPRPAGAAAPLVLLLPAPPHDLPAPGEVAATARLRAFVRTDLAGYDDDRDVPAVDHGAARLRALARCGQAARRSPRRGKRSE